MTAIGDDNAARIRSLSFFSHNFRLNVKISKDNPPSLSLKFRTTPTKVEIAEFVPSWYTFNVAAERAENGLKRLLEGVQEKSRRRPVNVNDFLAISATVGRIQPFLCRRMNLGYQGAVLLKEGLSVDEWPDTDAHLDKCDDCGYHRFTRGMDD